MLSKWWCERRCQQANLKFRCTLEPQRHCTGRTAEDAPVASPSISVRGPCRLKILLNHTTLPDFSSSPLPHSSGHRCPLPYLPPSLLIQECDVLQKLNVFQCGIACLLRLFCHCYLSKGIIEWVGKPVLFFITVLICTLVRRSSLWLLILPSHLMIPEVTEHTHPVMVGIVFSFATNTNILHCAITRCEQIVLVFRSNLGITTTSLLLIQEEREHCCEAGQIHASLRSQRSHCILLLVPGSYRNT